ncbi:MAG TPA: hypothetical protein VGM05_27145, partial [Planctomycetaceae bacterium]
SLTLSKSRARILRRAATLWRPYTKSSEPEKSTTWNFVKMGVTSRSEREWESCIAAENLSQQQSDCRSRKPSDGPDQLDSEKNESVRAIRSGPSPT